MREVELKAVVDDLADRRRRVELAGGSLSFEGRISDRRYDLSSRQLSARDEVLRMRTYQSEAFTKTFLDWKGPTEIQDVYKVREELTTPVDFESLEKIIEKLGFQLIGEIDRQIAEYQLRSATVRFEIYPRMDTLLEVEGEPAAIEEVIALIGMPRGLFSSHRLADFVDGFERRTGVKAALCDSELAAGRDS
jgi:predicted adenylyl cyclase CyaB